MVDAKEAVLTTADKVLIAVVALGQATAAAISESAGLGYSTTTPKLRALEEDGQAERIRTDDRRTLWQATAAGTNAARTLIQASPEAATVAADATTDEPAAPRLSDHVGPSSDPHSDPETTDIAEAVDPVEVDGSPADDAGEPAQEHDAGSPDNSAEPNGCPSPSPEVGLGTGDPDPQPGDEAHPAPVIGTGVEASSPDDHPSHPPASDATGSTSVGATGEGTAGTPARRPSGKPRRPKGELRNAVLTLLQSHPDTSYKVSEICRLLDRATDGTGVNKASAGAVANALDKLVGDGSVKQVLDRPATYQAE